MIQKRYLSVLLTTCVLALTGLMCVVPGISGDGTKEPNLTSTIGMIQRTQTALAEIPIDTPTVEVTATQANDPSPTGIPSNNSEPQTGSISGSLSFPSEGIPPLRVVAFNIESANYYYIETTQNQTGYKIENLPVGNYQVVAYVLDGNFAGGYSQSVICGLGTECNDHGLVNVQVAPNQESTNINPADWYAPPGSFPPDPVSSTQPEASQTGSISGNLSYPSEMIPPLQVVAFNIETGQYYYVLTAANQTFYSIKNLPPGFYHIVAYVFDNNFGGGYTNAVPCGLSVNCSDHSLIDVQVNSNQETSGIDPADWYAPDGSFPPKPAS